MTTKQNKPTRFYCRPIRTATAVLAVGMFLAAGITHSARAQSSGGRAKPKNQGSADSLPSMLVDKVDAIVNDAVILRSEVAMRLAPMAAELAQIEDERERDRRMRSLSTRIIDEMINEELMVQAALEAKLEVKPREVDAALNEIKKQNKLDDEGLADALARQGYTMTSYKKDVQRQILRMRVVNTLVRPKVTVSDDDIRARYDAMKRRSGAVSKVRLHHILLALPDNASEEQQATARERAADIIAKTKAGADFRKLAAAYSDDEATKNADGELGFIERGSIATEWETIVFAMEKGEVRGPIRGPRGLHVFYVSELQKAELEPFEKLKDQLRNELYRQELDKQSRIWLEELRKKAHIVRT